MRALPIFAVSWTMIGAVMAQVDGGLRDAAGSVGQALGPQALSCLIAIEGVEGYPEPKEWEFSVVDAGVRSGVRVLRANAHRATSRNTTAAGYPLAIPLGFFRWQDLRVGNAAAFATADREARAALVGFDSVQYLLRARDGTNVPVWLLTLLDGEKRIVGRLEISAVSGQVERRVWLRYGRAGNSVPIRVEDSICPIEAMRPVPAPLPTAAPAAGQSPAALGGAASEADTSTPPAAPAPEAGTAGQILVPPVPPARPSAPGYTPLP